MTFRVRTVCPSTISIGPWLAPDYDPGEELAEKTPANARAPRCVKDVIEERLFDKRGDLFTDLTAVFMDTTSLSFYGEGGEMLGAHGTSKDFRPDLKQMILGLVVDSCGRPVCTEMWPANTADVTTLLAVVDRLRQRFAIGRVSRRCRSRHDFGRGDCRAGGAQARIHSGRARAYGRARPEDRARKRRSVPCPLPSRAPKATRPLFVKDVKLEGRRTIVCRNEREAEKDRQDRKKIVAALQAQLERGEKALVGNSGYRRYLRKTKQTKSAQVFEIDPGKLAEEARFDGIFVLPTTTNITPQQAVSTYRDLLQVEDLFRRGKAILHTRPIFHSTDAAIRGYVFCTFLSLFLQKHLDDLAKAAGIVLEWIPFLRDLDRLQHARIRHRDKDWVVRTNAPASVVSLFRQAHVALPPRARQTSPPPQAPPVQKTSKRRGRPRRSATPSDFSMKNS